jgi:hypothetical protein
MKLIFRPVSILSCSASFRVGPDCNVVPTNSWTDFVTAAITAATVVFGSKTGDFQKLCCDAELFALAIIILVHWIAGLK